MNRNSMILLFILALVIMTGAAMYFYTSPKTKEKLIFAVDIVRHGDRTPLYSIPNLSDHWLEHGSGTLTSLGAAKSEELGKKFRRYYIEQTKLLAPKYNKNDIVIRATGYQRTEATAQNLVRGMYPEDYANIHIVSYDKDQDQLLLQIYKTQYELREKYLFYQTPESVQARIKELVSKVGAAIGHTFNKKTDILNISDVLKINTTHKLPLPAGLTQKDADEIESIRHTLLLNRFTAPEVECKSSNLLSHVKDIIYSFAANRDGPRYFLYVAHDYNLLGLLGLLSYKLEAVPPYNANLRFELLQSREDDLLVRVSYNGTPVELCGTELCTVSQFTNTLSDALQKKCTVTDAPVETPSTASDAKPAS